MHESARLDGSFLKDLGDGLILRRASPSDGEALSAFNAHVHRHEDTNEPEERVGTWTRDLVNRPHPTFRLGDFTLVEDTKTEAIVSSLCLISQTWSYDGIDFKVGRPELVGTDPAYRERGLVRSQFETIHRWSEQRGELVQAITGIPYYYRLFGYEMALELGGSREGFKPQVPLVNEGENEPYRFRRAVETDLPFLVDLYSQINQRYLVTCLRDEYLWQYELNGRTPDNVTRYEIKIIESQDGDAVGYLIHPPYRWEAMMPVTGIEIKPDLSWATVVPAVIRYLQSIGAEYPTAHGKDIEHEGFGFWLGSEHPVYDVVSERLPRVRDPYAWYLRVSDLPAFVQQIAPALEARLVKSSMIGHSGEIKLTFYNSGLRLVFEAGRLTGVEEWKSSPHRHSGNAGFPGLTFLQLIFGYRSLSELKYAFADCWTRDDQARVLLEVLFPKRASSVWPVS